MLLMRARRLEHPATVGWSSSHKNLPIGRYYGLMPGAYPRRTGLYVYVVIVTKDDLQPSARRYRAYMTNVERITGGLGAPVHVDLPDAYGATGTEAIEALEQAFETWQRDQSPRQS